MTTIKYHGIPYHVWNQGTDMDDFMNYFGVGPEIIIRGEGPYVYNQRGTRYINGLSGMWNLAAGLGREELWRRHASRCASWHSTDVGA